MHEYWHKQSISNPLYPDIEWEQPERKDLAGKLLIIGGAQNTFLSVAESYALAKEAGIGEAKAIIPESLRKITKDLPDIAYAPSNQAGSFSVDAKDALLYASQWADGVLFCGDYGRNSETAISLTNQIRGHKGLCVLVKDAIDLLHSEINFIANRENTVLVCSYSQLQKLAKALNDTTPFRYSDNLVHIVEHIHNFTLQHKVTIVSKHLDYLIAAVDGEVITTERKDLAELWCLKTASFAATYCVQHKNKKPSLVISAALLA